MKQIAQTVHLEDWLAAARRAADVREAIAMIPPPTNGSCREVSLDLSLPLTVSHAGSKLVHRLRIEHNSHGQLPNLPHNERFATLRQMQVGR